jgi:hypothetical protein
VKNDHYKKYNFGWFHYSFFNESLGKLHPLFSGSAFRASETFEKWDDFLVGNWLWFWQNLNVPKRTSNKQMQKTNLKIKQRIKFFNDDACECAIFAFSILCLKVPSKRHIKTVAKQRDKATLHHFSIESTVVTLQSLNFKLFAHDTLGWPFVSLAHAR